MKASPYSVELADPRASRPRTPLHRPEWLLTTGHGGFAMGCVDSGPGRRYHTLLNAAANPPVDRIATVGEPDFTLSVDNQDHQPLDWPLRFEKHPTRCRWTNTHLGFELVRELVLGWRANTAALRCTLKRTASDSAATLRFRVPVLLRDFHNLDASIAPSDFNIHSYPDGFDASRSEQKTMHTVRVRCTAAGFAAQPRTSVAAPLPHELDRGDPTAETRFSPGIFEATLAPGESSITVDLLIAFADEPLPRDLLEDTSREQRLTDLTASLKDPNLRALAIAADDFLVERTVDGQPCMSVIAGYPWFADWGRDTMIALPGLLLVPGRFDEALSTLRTFARYVSQGMIPNRFDDYGGPPHYNTVDASLWFHHAASEYLRTSQDREGYRSELLPACLAIIEGYLTGTRFGIGVDPADALVFSGDDSTQLTWMDAKRDGKVFTPRHGKAVEINALWFNALRSTAQAIRTVGADPAHADRLDALAERVRAGFNSAFLSGPDGGLVDCLRSDATAGWLPTDELRPNQLFAVSLPHSPIERGTQQRIVEVCRHHLLTPMGMRTLAPTHPRYRPRFEGDMISRDDAYHNGTVWPWLIGPMAEAVLRVSEFNEESRAEARAMIQPLIDTMSSGCIGQICEVSDAQGEQLQQGCIAQAWSVAEVLRISALIS